MSDLLNAKKEPTRLVALVDLPKPSEIEAEMAWLNFAIALRLNGQSPAATNNGLLAASLEVIFGFRKNEAGLFNIFKECEEYRQRKQPTSREEMIKKLCDYWNPHLLPKDKVKEDTLESMVRLLDTAVHIIYLSRGLDDYRANWVAETEHDPDTDKDKDKDKKAYSIPLGQQATSIVVKMNWEWPWKTKSIPNVRVDGKPISLGKPWFMTEFLGEHLKSYAQGHLNGKPPKLLDLEYVSESGQEKKGKRLLLEG
ncbi:MAG: hypothetical protein Q9167_002114 [Letrouitia subvulpina]